MASRAGEGERGAVLDGRRGLARPGAGGRPAGADRPSCCPAGPDLGRAAAHGLFPDVVEVLVAGRGPAGAIVEGGRRRRPVRRGAAPVRRGHVPAARARHRRGGAGRAGGPVLLRVAVCRRSGPHRLSVVELDQEAGGNCPQIGRRDRSALPWTESGRGPTDMECRRDPAGWRDGPPIGIERAQRTAMTTHPPEWDAVYVASTPPPWDIGLPAGVCPPGAPRPAQRPGARVGCGTGNTRCSRPPTVRIAIGVDCVAARH